MKSGKAFAMYRLGLNLDDADDNSHASWNDIRGMLKDVGLWKHMLLMCGAYNLNYGSFYAPDRSQQVSSATADTTQLLSPETDAQFQQLLPLMLEDAGRLNERGSPTIGMEMYRIVRNDKELNLQGEKV